MGCFVSKEDRGRIGVIEEYGGDDKDGGKNVHSCCKKGKEDEASEFHYDSEIENVKCTHAPENNIVAYSMPGNKKVHGHANNNTQPKNAENIFWEKKDEVTDTAAGKNVVDDRGKLQDATAKSKANGLSDDGVQGQQAVHPETGVEMDFDSAANDIKESNSTESDEIWELKDSMKWYPTHATSTLLYNTITFDSEKERYLSLEECNVLESPEKRFDVIVDVVSSFFDVPCAAVSLIYDTSVLAKAVKGPFTRFVPREGSMCSYIFVPTQEKVMIVEDSTRDVRFSGNPYVKGPPHLRYYSGCPLVASKNGFRYGTLCVLDFKPRPNLPLGLYNILCNFAELTVRELEKDVDSVKLDENNGINNVSQSGRGNRSIHDGVIAINTSEEHWPVVYANSVWCDYFNSYLDDVIGKSLWDIFDLQSLQGQPNELKSRLLTEGAPLTIELDFCLDTSTLNSGNSSARVDFLLASRDHLSGSLPVGIPTYSSTELEMEKEEENVEAVVNNSCEINEHTEDQRESTAEVKLQDDNSILQKTRSGDALLSLLLISIDFNSISRSSSEKSRVPERTCSRSNSDCTQRARRKPKILSHLKLQHLIGVGSYGKVYRGKLGSKTVAVKIIDTHEISSVKSKQVTEKAFQEALLSHHLAHPNIVPTLNYAIIDEDTNDHYNSARFCTNDSRGSECIDAEDSLSMSSWDSSSSHSIWIVQHFCNRGTLSEAIDMGWFRQHADLNSPPNLRFVIWTALEIASALQYLHEEALLHGDLSGNNILLTESNKDERGFTAMVSDFGLSRAMVDQKTKTMGTISYMPPETLSSGTVSQSADIYAFGVLLWEMIVGRKAWAGCHMAQIVYFLCVENRRLELPDNAPTVLKSLVNLCLHIDPSSRPNFSVVGSILQEYNNNTFNVCKE